MFMNPQNIMSQSCSESLIVLDCAATKGVATAAYICTAIFGYFCWPINKMLLCTVSDIFNSPKVEPFLRLYHKLKQTKTKLVSETYCRALI